MLTPTEITQKLQETHDLMAFLQGQDRKYRDLYERVNKVIAEEHLNGIRSSTDIARRLLEERHKHQTFCGRISS